jgi:hypothetical protein
MGGGGDDTKNRHLKCKVVHRVAVGAIAAPNTSRVVKLATPPVLSMPKAGDHRLIKSGSEELDTSKSDHRGSNLWLSQSLLSRRRAPRNKPATSARRILPSYGRAQTAATGHADELRKRVQEREEVQD